MLTKEPAVVPLTQPSEVARDSGVLRRLARGMARLARWRLVLGSGTIFVTFASLFFASSLPFAIPQVGAACGQPPPDVRFGASAADVLRFLDACGPAGREAYRHLQLADLAYPAVFGFFLATLLALVISRLAAGRPGLLAVAAVPLLGATFDYLENACAWLALSAYPEPTWTSSLFGVASAAKNISFWSAGVVLLLALGLLAATRLRSAARR